MTTKTPTRFTFYFWSSFRMLIIAIVLGCIWAFSSVFEQSEQPALLLAAGIIGACLGSAIMPILFRLPLTERAPDAQG